MALLKFRKISLADWLLLTDKDPNTRYTVINEDGSIYGEYIGNKIVTGRVYEPDEVTIILNEEGKLKVSKNLKIDGGFL